ncbi:hypothetical protein D3C72_1206160 [compost metagenome]
MAASTIRRARTSEALAAVSTWPMAAGISTSQSMIKSSSLAIGSPPGKPFTVRCLATHSSRAGMSRPSGLWMPPLTSEVATTLPPASAKSRQVWLPTLPKPCTTKRHMGMVKFIVRRASSVM